MIAVGAVNFGAPSVSFLWHNVIGAVVVVVSRRELLSSLGAERRASSHRSGRCRELDGHRPARRDHRRRVRRTVRGARAQASATSTSRSSTARTTTSFSRCSIRSRRRRSRRPTSAAPIRWLLRKQRNTDVLLAEVAVDRPRAARRARASDGRELDYDFLIVAAGARHSYFGHPEWEAFAPGLKSVEDAIELRRRWLLAFERAEQATDDAERARGAHVRHRRRRTDGRRARRHAADDRAITRCPSDFRHIDTASARIILIEGGPRILPAFPEDLSERARAGPRRSSASRSAPGQRVTDVGDGYVEIGGERIEARTDLLGGGQRRLAARRVARRADRSRGPRARSSDDLSVPGHPEVFVVGDLAVLHEQGKPVPGVAPAAMQSGKRRGAQHHPHDPRRGARAVPLPQQGRPRDDRPIQGRRRPRRAPS